MENKNNILLINLLMVVAGVLLLVAYVPELYDRFCKVTGFGGTTQVAAELPTDIRDRTVKINYNSDVDSSLDWYFKPDQLQTEIKVGENGLAFYTVRNNADEPVKAMASYNVTPLKAGKYFNKVYCFCFEEQEIKAGEEIQFPVSYFIDPAFDDDEYMDDVKTITLSYTFFRVRDEE